ERARDAYRDGALRASLARHHADPDAVFWRWNRIWLSEAFRSWSIESELASIRCPVLAVQGVDDPYGTLAQVYGIQARVPASRVVELPGCGHSPHRDQPERLLRELVSFIG
ncbi:MAG: alpha/beta fold hydrolase, partial [Betaproteobacteria bacterium]